MTRKRGRPTEYDPERHPFLAMCLAREGLTEREMAQMAATSDRSRVMVSLWGGLAGGRFRFAATGLL